MLIGPIHPTEKYECPLHSAAQENQAAHLLVAKERQNNGLCSCQLKIWRIMTKIEFQYYVSNNTCQFEVFSNLDYVYKK